MIGLRIVVAVAGLFGAAGVALAAVAAHVAGGSTLSTGAEFLILHAASVVALAAWGERSGRLAMPVLACAVAMLAGVALFSGDLALRQLAGTKLLWGTAPFGGTLMIVAWLGIAATAAFWHGRWRQPT